MKKIIIVGGGSAGWMTASALIKNFKEFDITVIESKNYPRVGVGESTYDGIQYFIKYLGIDLNDFFSNTDATIKLGIKFKNFLNKENNDEFIYPFGIPDLSGTKFGLDDWLIKKYINKNLNLNEFSESYFPSMSLIKNNTFNENKYGELSNFNPALHSALHFDAIKFADWLKYNFAIKNGVKLIEEDVIDIKISNNGIKNIILSNNESIEADLYIDCTGFKGLLINQALKTKFISYSDILPNDSAWATQIEYIDKANELIPATTSTAIGNGWVWNIPLWSRIGTGYVYSSKYISDDEALDEFKKYLINDANFKRNANEINNLSFRNIKMRVGINEKVWNKNVVAIGLSSGFIEPLQSNGLFTVHEFIYELIRSLLRGSPSQFDIDVFNKKVHNRFNSFVEFIRMHYYLSKRTDTKYWNDIFINGYKNIEKSETNYESDHYLQLIRSKTYDYRTPANYGIACVSIGMNYLFIDDVSARLGEISHSISYSDVMNPYFQNLDNKKNSWNYVAANSISYPEYLKKKFYS